MAWTIRDHKLASTDGTPCSVTVDSSAADLIVLFLFSQQAITGSPAPTESTSPNSWTQAEKPSTQFYAAYCRPTNKSATHAINFNSTDHTWFFGGHLHVLTISGSNAVNTLDIHGNFASSNAPENTSCITNSPDLTPTQSGDLLISCFGRATISLDPAIGTATILDTGAANGGTTSIAWDEYASTSAVHRTWTPNTGNLGNFPWGILMGFSPSGGSGGSNWAPMLSRTWNRLIHVP